MSVLGPMYDIPAEIRHGIFILYRWDNKECIEYGLNEIRESFRESASNLSTEQVKENMEYIDNIQTYLNELMELYAKLGINIPEALIKRYFKLGVDLGYEEPEESEEEESVEEAYTLEQKFCRHVLADYENDMISQVKLATIALKVVEIAKEEISKYLPENPNISGGEKVLKPTPKTE